MAFRVNWEGVFPAVTTQFRDDYSVDIEATRRVIDALIRDGVAGLIICGTVGENCSLAAPEKIAVVEAAKDVARGRVPVPGCPLRLSDSPVAALRPAAPLGQSTGEILAELRAHEEHDHVVYA